MAATQPTTSGTTADEAAKWRPPSASSRCTFGEASSPTGELADGVAMPLPPCVVARWTAPLNTSRADEAAPPLQADPPLAHSVLFMPHTTAGADETAMPLPPEAPPDWSPHAEETLGRAASLQLDELLTLGALPPAPPSGPRHVTY